MFLFPKHTLIRDEVNFACARLRVEIEAQSSFSVSRTKQVLLPSGCSGAAKLGIPLPRRTWRHSCAEFVILALRETPLPDRYRYRFRCGCCIDYGPSLS